MVEILIFSFTDANSLSLAIQKLKLTALVNLRGRKWNYWFEVFEKLNQRLYRICESEEEKNPLCFLCNEETA